jgi:hypothetical protein
MPPLKRGDIVFVYKYPFEENNKEGKQRMAVVLEDLGDEVLLGYITTVLEKEQKYKKVIHIKSDTPDFDLIGLDVESLIILDDIKQAQLLKIRILTPPLGRCSDSILKKIDELIN